MRLFPCFTVFAAGGLLALVAIPTAVPAVARAAQAVPPPLLRQAVADLPVTVEARDGYKRTSFKHWTDADSDGCSARYEVLIAEAIDAPKVGSGCKLTGGAWYSYYDDVVVNEAAQLDVDHLVPLAEAWDSGASAWDAAKREQYANHLDHPEHLVAVTARSNRQKADKDPAEWLPIEQVHCRYIAEWVAVKRHWQLSVDSAEKAKLAEVASTCPNAPLTLAS
ncbi:HNH endonuclease family protein [Nonomuraea zeae]|uniref:HNH endonuclease n=1 Tax=Nonomuraea zeae TaxID=1642303 RepID=A0A5S4H4D4_9ACTN|nr:HNH endonuclease family protein [Nonomuraea zeae]TMR39604.1 HNH endonuclease [Nonomuraea zeae]